MRLAEQIIAAAEFEGETEKALCNMLESLWENVDRVNDAHEGARLENARLRPLVCALAQCIAMLEDVLRQVDLIGAVDDHATYEALDKLKAELTPRGLGHE